MEIQVAVVCDSAVDYGGKLCLLGSFDTIMAPNFPAVHPQCSVALRIVFRKEDEGMHQLRLNFVNDDGKDIVPPLEAAMEIALPPNFFFTSRNVILNLQRVEFTEPGSYEIDIAIDGRQTASIPLQVMSPPVADE